MSTFDFEDTIDRLVKVSPRWRFRTLRYHGGDTWRAIADYVAPVVPQWIGDVPPDLVAYYVAYGRTEAEALDKVKASARLDKHHPYEGE